MIGWRWNWRWGRVAKGWSSYSVFDSAQAISDRCARLGCAQIVTLVATPIALGTKLSSRFSAVTAIKVSVVGGGRRCLLHQGRQLLPFILEPEVQLITARLDQLSSVADRAQGSHYGWYGVGNISAISRPGVQRRSSR